MKTFRRILLVLLHVVVTVAVQAFLLAFLIWIGDTTLGWLLRYLLASLLALIADGVLSYLLLNKDAGEKGIRPILQFWDFILCVPAFFLIILGFYSVPGYAVAALLMELLLITERAATFILCDPKRKQE